MTPHSSMRRTDRSARGTARADVPTIAAALIDHGFLQTRALFSVSMGWGGAVDILKWVSIAVPSRAAAVDHPTI
jgi:hypothetical protein